MSECVCSYGGSERDELKRSGVVEVVSLRAKRVIQALY